MTKLQKPRLSFSEYLFFYFFFSSYYLRLDWSKCEFGICLKIWFQLNFICAFSTPANYRIPIFLCLFIKHGLRRPWVKIFGLGCKKCEFCIYLKTLIGLNFICAFSTCVDYRIPTFLCNYIKHGLRCHWVNIFGLVWTKWEFSICQTTLFHLGLICAYSSSFVKFISFWEKNWQFSSLSS